MNFRIIKTVIAREYLTRVKKKSFIVTTILVPLIFAATMIIVGLIMAGTKERKQDVAVVDRSGIVMSHLQDTDRLTFTDYSSDKQSDRSYQAAYQRMHAGAQHQAYRQRGVR